MTKFCPSPYDPSYGYPDSFRFFVLREAERRGTKETAELFGIGRSTIYQWQRDIEKQGTD